MLAPMVSERVDQASDRSFDIRCYEKDIARRFGPETRNNCDANNDDRWQPRKRTRAQAVLKLLEKDAEAAEGSAVQGRSGGGCPGTVQLRGTPSGCAVLGGKED